MAKKPLCLATFDNKSIDGLIFCRKVYDLFDQVKNGPDGTAKLRVDRKLLEKRLLEELIPIARFVQNRYREGRRLKVRWLSGSQSYDAHIRFSGELVEMRNEPKEALVEVTTAYPKNHHLALRQLHEHGMTWGAKSISINKKTKTVTSKPYVFMDDERAVDMVRRIVECIDFKAEKSYPSCTILIVNCVPGNLLLDDEWEEAVELVSDADKLSAFREVFLVESERNYSATLYGKIAAEKKPEQE